jgi:hypothetical protein
MINNRFFDHLPNRKRLSFPALAVRGLKPIKAAIWIVGPLLLRKKQHKTVTVRERRPSGAKVVPCRGLGASVQHDDERGIVGKARRSIDEHSQITWVRSEAEVFPQARGGVACGAGMMTFQRLKQFSPSGPAAAEAERLSQIFHCGSFPVARVT